MKRWQTISVIAFGLLAYLSQAGNALAQDTSGNLPPVLGSILVKMATIVDGILSYWVDSATGNTLTQPAGEKLISGLAELARNFVLFLADFFRVLSFG